MYYLPIKAGSGLEWVWNANSVFAKPVEPRDDEWSQGSEDGTFGEKEDQWTDLTFALIFFLTLFFY